MVGKHVENSRIHGRFIRVSYVSKIRVAKTGEMKMPTTLREFKAWSIARAIELKRQLVEKYPEKRERVEHIIDLLINKLRNLRVFTLTDYLAVLYDASKEFPEFEALIPSSKTVEELLKSGD